MSKQQWYGSLDNRVEEGRTYGEIRVGMGATEYLWSDRNPYEVIEVIDAKHVVVRKMNWKRIDHNGMSESQEYEFFQKPDGETKKLSLTKSGWRERENCGKLGSRFALGVMDRYYDYTF